MPPLYSLRSDLEYSRQTQQGESYVVVKDPISNRYFRFSPTQAAVLELLRQPMSLEQLEEAAASALGPAAKRETLEGFLESLRGKHLLTDPGTEGEVARESAAGRQDSLLYLRLVSFDAEKVFDWLAPRTRWFFTKPFHVFAIAAILSGLVITVLHTDRLVGSVFSLFSVYGLFMIWCVGIGVVTLHELAHGLTCRHFGGRVRELGFMLIYFQPALYCDVTDSWMLPSRTQRMWVTFAGGYFQLVIWGLAAIVWRLTVEDALINQIALIAIIFSGLQTLLNFNPLIRLDGYYMLSDYLEIPNLRSKARQAVQTWLAEGAQAVPRVERRPLLVYGSLSLMFSSLLLSVVYANIYLLATSYLGFAGLIGFVLFSGMTLKRTAAEPAAGARALVTRASARKYYYLGAAALLLLATFIVPWQLRIAADFRVLAGEEQIIRALTDGTVEDVLVSEGKWVHHGQKVAYLYNFEREDEIGRLEGELEAKEAELARLKAGPTEKEIEEAEARVATKEQELANVRRNVQEREELEQKAQTAATNVEAARYRLEQQTQLHEEGLGPESAMIEARMALEVREGEAAAAQAALAGLDEKTDREEDLKEREMAEAESQLERLLAGNRAEEIEQIQGEVTNLTARLMNYHQESLKSEIVSPISGTVTTRFVERLVGEHVSRGDELMRIVNLESLIAELDVPEKEISEVEIGSNVTLKAHSDPGNTFHGQVSFISPVATENPSGNRVVKVEVQLAETNDVLRPEVTGVAKIEAGWHPIFKLMTRRMVRWLQTEFWDLLP